MSLGVTIVFMGVPEWWKGMSGREGGVLKWQIGKGFGEEGFLEGNLGVIGVLKIIKLWNARKN